MLHAAGIAQWFSAWHQNKQTNENTLQQINTETLCERSKTQWSLIVWFHVHETSRIRKSIDTECGLGWPGLGERGMGT